MAFLIHSIANENVVPWEYFPCSDALITGEVLAFKDGKMVSATAGLLATKVPLYLSMCEKGAGEEEIPAVRIRDDMILEGYPFVMYVKNQFADFVEGARGFMSSLADLPDDEGLVSELRRTLHVSHMVSLLAEDSAAALLFEVVGVAEPESEDMPIPKVLIRLIG